MDVVRQTWTLIAKNFLIVLQRHSFATVVRAFVLPVVLMAFLSFARAFFVPSARFGISEPNAVRSLPNALAATTSSGRDTVAFVHSGFRGGDIERVIDELAEVVTGAGKKATVLASEIELTTTCRASWT